jgi:catechol 2,3-dioxygenase-like lactoylglutathione lyase family enzyme
MDWKLEVATIPVADLDRSKKFYEEVLGFNVDVDNDLGEAWRNIQFTPHGSATSLAIGKGFNHGLQLVVSDIDAAHEELVGRGLKTSGIVHFEGGEQKPGRGDGPYNSFFFFEDPDGNGWAVQEK